MKRDIQSRGNGANGQIVPTSLQGIRHFREEIRGEHIRNIDINPDGTVSVGTSGPVAIWGHSYNLKKGPKRWQITESRLWATMGLDFDDGAN